MKVRVRKEPCLTEHRWRIETKQWWQILWKTEEVFYGDKSKEHALALAHEYASSTIIEVKK